MEATWRPMGIGSYRGTAEPLPVQEQIDLLKRVRKIIQEEPKRLDMSVWGLKQGQGMEDLLVSDLFQWPACGTIACLAGWLVLATESTEAESWRKFLSDGGMVDAVDRKYKGGRVPEVAAALLGMHVDDTPFFKTKWDYADVDEWIGTQIQIREAQVAGA